LRLLIDEMYPAAIAEQLRGRGYDVSAVTERVALRSLADAAIFATAQDERRAVVTENVADFVPLADTVEQRGKPHHGLVLADPAKFPRGNPRIRGRMVRELLKLLAQEPSDHPRSLRHWL
jgi:predicted nuclease of predicted toxin-antitoxin system